MQHVNLIFSVAGWWILLSLSRAGEAPSHKMSAVPLTNDHYLLILSEKNIGGFIYNKWE